MSKRFTDTDKWKDDWYLSLSNNERIVWQYICDNCTNAGRLKKNFKLLNFCCNVELDDLSFKQIFNGRVVDCGDFYFVPKFLKFQYPKGLNSNKPAILAIKEEILRYNLLQIVSESLGNHYLMVMDKDKEKDKEKDIGGMGGKGFVKPTVEDIKTYCEERKNGIDAEYFWNWYESVGWKVGSKPMKSWRSAIITWEKRRPQEANDGLTPEQRRLLQPRNQAFRH